MATKVLRIIARLNIGGPARNAVLLTEGLRHKGFDTVLLCGEVPKTEGDMMYLAKQKGIEPIVIEELGREISIVNDWKAFWKVYRIICTQRPDIVHTHTAKAGTLGRIAVILYNLVQPRRLTYAVNLRGWTRVRMVHTFHGHVLHSYFGRVKTLFFIWIERILGFWTDSIITVSASLKKELVERFKIANDKKFSVIELGFELDELLNMPLKENANGVINIGIVGRLTAVKNHKMLFRILHKLTTYNLKLKTMIIGDGEMREELERYAEELGIKDRVEFKGWVKDLCGIYEGLDIVVLTSLNEGTPVSIIEAMAAGKPVVTTGVGGVLDIVQDGRSGYVVSRDNEEDFEVRLLDLIGNAQKRRQFGEFGRTIVKERFSKDRLISDVERLYNRLLSKV